MNDLIELLRAKAASLRAEARTVYEPRYTSREAYFLVTALQKAAAVLDEHADRAQSEWAER